jgi:hypothetical protein
MHVLLLQRTRAIAWCPATVGPSYSFATAADMDVYLWGVNPYSALVSIEGPTQLQRGPAMQPHLAAGCATTSNCVASWS